MRIVIIDKKSSQKRINKLIDWLLHMIGYALILIAMSVLFKNTIQIDNQHFGVWGLIAAIIIYFLNKTIKPILFWLTLPITGLTLGIFYPFINVFILNIVAWVLGNHFNIPGGLLMTFIVAVLISLINIMMDALIEDILRKEK